MSSPPSIPPTLYIYTDERRTPLIHPGTDNIIWTYRLESGEVKLAVGDELRIKYGTGSGDSAATAAAMKPWDGTGHVIKIPNSA